MRILVVSQRYWPEQFQVTSICEGLASRGHEITVMCGLPNVGVPDVPQGIVLAEYRAGHNRIQHRNGVEIQRCFEVGRRTGIPFRILNYYSFWKSALFKSWQLPAGKFDVVFGYQLSPAMMCVPAASYARRTETPFLLYCCDLWPESMKALLGERLKSVVKHYGRICKKMYQAADTIAIQSPTFASYFKEYHDVLADKLVYIPQFSTDAAGDSIPIKPHDGVNAVFMGNMGSVQCIPMMIDAMGMIGSKAKISLHFIGDGSVLEEAKKLVKQKNLDDKVVFHGRRPISDMAFFYSIADICVLGLDSSTFIGTTIPSKLQGYMTAGRAVVAATSGGAKYVIEDSDCGIAVEPGDSIAFANALLELATDQSRRDRCAENARRYALAHFTREAYLDAIEREMIKIVDEKGKIDNG